MYLARNFSWTKIFRNFEKIRSLLISKPSHTVTVLSQFCEYTVNSYRKKAWVEALKSLIPQYSCRERSCPPVGKRVGVNHVRSSKLKIRVIVWHENPLIELMKKWMNFEEKVNFEGWRRRFRKNGEFDSTRKRIWKGNYDSWLFMCFHDQRIISVSSLINFLVCPPNRTSRFVLGIGSTLQIGRQHPMVTLRWVILVVITKLIVNNFKYFWQLFIIMG